MSRTEQDDTALAQVYATVYPGALAAALALVLLAVGWTALGQDVDGPTAITLAVGGVATVVLVVLLLLRRHRDGGWSVALQILALAACAAVAGQVGLVGVGLFAAGAALLLFLVVVLGTVLRADRPTRPRGSVFD